MNSRRAWVLNLDAEHELEARGNYAPTLHLSALVARERVRLFNSLVAPDDIVLNEHDIQDATGLPGFAWCPTPRALALLRRAGAIPIESPSLDILRQVNSRPFATLVRHPHFHSSFEKHTATSLDEALTHISTPSPNGWLIRRLFGAAGRGRRRIASGTPDPAEHLWLIASLRRGPLTIEPWVELTREYTRSAWLHKNGQIKISAPCFQQTTQHGSWLQTDLANPSDISRDDDYALEEMVSLAGAALHTAGYFGPFGIDAYRHRIPTRSHPTEVLNPLSEINARFTMDWATAMVPSPDPRTIHDHLDNLTPI